MVQLNICEKTSLANKENSSFNYITFDGCNYFLLSNCCYICKYSKCLKAECCINTCRKYSCICYDWQENCFWATSKDCYYKIFKLNKDFVEIDCINLCKYTDFGAIITGISYNCCNNTLMVTSLNALLEVDKDGCNGEYLQRTSGILITGILSICKGYIITVIKKNKECIQIYSPQNKLTAEFCLPECNIKNIILNPCNKDCSDFQLNILINQKGCYSYIYKIEISACILGFSPCYCNYCICNKHCHHKPCPPIPPIVDPCADLIESIALVETAISHILNAEGEKIQKILQISDNPETILKVNKEVNRTIVNATHLEHVLFAKLESVRDNFCKDNDCCDHKLFS